MIKVVCIVDKVGTALWRLGKGVEPYHKNINYLVLDCHPKRPSQDQLMKIELECKDADIIDSQYYKTMDMLRERYPWLKDIPTIQTMNNPYAIHERDWNDYQVNVGNNQEIYKKLGEITTQPVEYIPLTVDTEFWTYNPDWTPNRRVLMVANRIEGKKGILEVAEACKKIDAQLVLVGDISDQDYFHEIVRTGGIEFHQRVTDEELRKLYHGATVHVCNSVDNFESGTLPILEAMLCGTPVLTRKVGHVPELNNGENMVIHENKENVDEIAEALGKMLDNPDKLKELRDKAWQTAKSRSHERRAFLYQKLYRQVLYPDQQSVTVITPVCEKPEITEQCIKSIEGQTYKNLELIIVNDGEPANIKANTPLFRLIGNGQNDYGLARARNKAVIEATGEILVFCDQRVVMEPNAIEEFVKNLQRGKWIYGQKNGVKKEMVENFSCVYRDELIRKGMFCERLDEYGGQSQYVRSIAKINGMTLQYIETAKAQQIGKSSNKNRKRAEIIRSKTRLWKMGLEG